MIDATFITGALSLRLRALNLLIGSSLVGTNCFAISFEKGYCIVNFFNLFFTAHNESVEYHLVRLVNFYFFV